MVLPQPEEAGDDLGPEAARRREARGARRAREGGRGVLNAQRLDEQRVQPGHRHRRCRAERLDDRPSGEAGEQRRELGLRDRVVRPEGRHVRPHQAAADHDVISACAHEGFGFGARVQRAPAAGEEQDDEERGAAHRHASSAGRSAFSLQRVDVRDPSGAARGPACGAARPRFAPADDGGPRLSASRWWRDGIEPAAEDDYEATARPRSKLGATRA